MSSDDEFDKLVTASVKKNREKRKLNRAGKAIKLNFDLEDSPRPALPKPSVTREIDTTAESDGLENFFDKLRVEDELRNTPKYPSRPLPPMKKFIVSDNDSDSDDDFEKTSIIEPEQNYSTESDDSSDDSDNVPELDKTVELISRPKDEDNFKENIRQKNKTKRLPSNKDDSIYISSDSDDFIIKKTPRRKQILTPTAKTPINLTPLPNPNDRVDMTPCTPEQIRKTLFPKKNSRIKTPKPKKTPLTPMEKIIKKDEKVDFSPASRRKL
jgi:hypothetical protein